MVRFEKREDHPHLATAHSKKKKEHLFYNNMATIEHNEYHLNWNDHMNYVRRNLSSLLEQNELVDVTLYCEGEKLFAHKMLLSVCSSFFLEVFKENPCSHPVVILKGVNCKQMKDLLKFMYDGEVVLEPEDFESFLKTAKLLNVYGLTECDGVNGFTQSTAKIKPAAESNTEHIIDIEENKIAAQIISIDDADIKAETFTCINDVGSNIVRQGQISETIQTFEFTEMQVSPQYEDESPELLEIPDTANELLQDQPSEATLHLHRCFSSTAPAVKRKFNKEAEDNNSEGTSSTKPKQTKRMICSVCAKTFTHINSLRQHMKVHTEGALCTICGKMLCRRYQLKVHLKKQHGIDFIPSNQAENTVISIDNTITV